MEEGLDGTKIVAEVEAGTLAYGIEVLVEWDLLTAIDVKRGTVAVIM